jgi:hypothetical protein
MQQRINAAPLMTALFAVAYFVSMLVFPQTALAEPSLLSPANGSPHAGSAYTMRSVTFTWDNVSGADSETTYDLLVANVHTVDEYGKLTNPSLAEQTNLTDTSITLDNLPDGQVFWQVRAVSSSGETSPWSQVWDFLIDATAPHISMATFSNDPTRPVIEGYSDDSTALITIFIDGVAQGNADMSATANENNYYYWEFNLQKKLAYGSYAIRALAIDPHGNSIMASQFIMVNPPIIADVAETPDFAVNTFSVGGLAVPISERKKSRSAIHNASSSLDLQQAILGDAAAGQAQPPLPQTTSTMLSSPARSSGSLQWVLAAIGVVFIVASSYMLLRPKSPQSTS